MQEPLHILKQYWGYDSFRVPQNEIIDTVLKGEDVLALLPTGGGKSICFQVPSMCMEGLTLVVSPLIALMKDQVHNLRKRGIKADAITSGLTRREIALILDNATYGKTKLLYVSPERLESEDFLVRLKQMKVVMLAVDEAHCISQWGYDFRPPYLRIAAIRAFFPHAPVIALTATATPSVVEDIMHRLEFRKKLVISKSFERKNLTYWVSKDGNKPGALLQALHSFPGCAVVYTRNRRRAREIAEMLVSNGITASFYHAGLSNRERDERQADWINNITRVIVATNAFGMGIDKPDVRLVVHMDIPDNLEAYFQEAGRAGRDEKPANALVIFNETDRLMLLENFEKSFPEKAIIKRVYEAIGNFLEVAIGYGKDETYPFDLGEFCKRFKIQPIQTLSALRILEVNRLIYLTESVYSPSRVKIITSPEQLYHFELNNPVFQPLLKFMLRGYSGVYDQHTGINERTIAHRLGTPPDDIKKKLTFLHRRNILEYLPESEAPRITFLQPRKSSNALSISRESYEERKALASKRIDHVLTYMQGKHCRSAYLRHYFGEQKVANCGQCDYCVGIKHSHAPLTGVNQMLKALHEKGEMDIRELLQLSVSDQKRSSELLRLLMDENLVRYNERGNVSLTISGAKRIAD